MTQSKIVCFQLQLDKGEEPLGLRHEAIRTLIASAGGRIANEEFAQDEGNYINLYIPTDRPSNFLCVIDDGLELNPDLARSLIIICEGSKGWNDYLLVRHPDEDEQTDSPSGEN